ncbi:MAG: DUF4199 domain-containing protein [Balneolales bacterium]
MEPQQSNDISYWNAVTLTGIIFGLIVFVLNIIGGYATIGAEPSGGWVGPSMFTGLFSCLLAAFGGMVAVRIHLKQNPQPPLQLGRGAMIGLATGIVIAFVSTVLGLIWNIIDPSFSQNLIEASIANIEAMNIPEDQKQEMIDSVAAQMQQMYSVGGLVMAFVLSSLLYGILNMLTGMLGVKFYSPNEEV